MNDDIRYPVGPCVWSAELSPEEKRQHLRDIAEMPAKLREAVAGLSPQHLDIPIAKAAGAFARSCTTSRKAT
jgi:hypothetical protein